jgi:hypothetical protein
MGRFGRQIPDIILIIIGIRMGLRWASGVAAAFS